MERDIKNLEALLAAVNRSAERLQTLWFSFLALTLYFIITALTTTHRMLLLEEAQSLPIINLKVPLLPFYVIAPMFYLVLHFYVLMMLVLLARSAAIFERALTLTFPLESERELFRMRVENALFLQLLVGAREEREGFNGRLMALIALITLAVAPVATLLVMQLQFLPYHHGVITWLHRALLSLDCLLVLLLWRGYRHRGGQALPEPPLAVWRARGAGWPLRVAPAVIGLFAVIWISLWEGRWAGEPWLDPAVDTDGRLLIASGIFADRLSLPNETIVGDALLLERQREAEAGCDHRRVPTRDFRGRNFAYADFQQADLRGVSFSPDPRPGQPTILRQANLIGAQIQGANLDQADLQGASLMNAEIQGACLQETDMQGAWLDQAKMQGVNLTGAQMQGASLARAHMEGARFAGAKLQGANLEEAYMQGANLVETHMQAADLNGAQLQGARLIRAQLQGARLNGAQMKGAQVQGTILFRADADFAWTNGAWFGALTLGKVQIADGVIVPFDDADVEKWKSVATRHAQMRNRDFIARRFSALTGEWDERDALSAASWRKRATESAALNPDDGRRRAELATLYGDLACGGGSRAPHLARALSRGAANATLSRLGEQLDTVRSRIKSVRAQPAQCPGVVGFTDSDWESIEAVIAYRD